MTLHEYRDVEQRSDRWRELRRGIVTASVAGKLVTPKNVKPASNDESRGLAASLAAERVTGFVEETYTNADMFRGIEAEPFARDKYVEHNAPVVECGFMVREFDGFEIGLSPDGLVGDDGLIEIKAPRAKTHLATVVRDEVPLMHMGQLQTALLVSGRDWIDFVSYCGGMPLWVRRVEPDPKWQAAIVEAVEQTEKAITELVATYERAVVGLPETERIDFTAVGLEF